MREKFPMRTRSEPYEALPPIQTSKVSRWMPLLPELQDTAIGSYLVVTVEKELPLSAAEQIEKFARVRGIRVKARKRGREIWVERLRDV